MTKDFEITITIRNGRLISAMKNAGIETTAELARRSGLNMNSIHRFAKMKDPGFRIDGKWRNVIEKLAVFFRCLPEDLVPPAVRTTPMRKNTAKVLVNTEDIQILTTSLRTLALPADKHLEHEQTLVAIHEMLSKLRPKEERVIRERFGIGCEEKTLDEIGEEFGVGRERIRQIELSALRKLKRPTVKKKLAHKLGSKIIATKYDDEIHYNVDGKDIINKAFGEDE